MHPPEHYDDCIKDSQETIARLERQLTLMPRRRWLRWRMQIQDRIACERKAIELFERDKQEAMKCVS